MKNLKRIALAMGLALIMASASYAEFRFGGELTAGFAAEKLFNTEESRYLNPVARSLTGVRLSVYVGADTGNEDSKFAFGFEQHAGIHPATLSDSLPLVFSLPSRLYFRVGSERLALDILAGIDNQFVIHGSKDFPAYYAYDHNFDSRLYEAAPSGYSMGLEVGLRLVIRHFYLTGIVAVPVSTDYLFPGMIRFGLGLTF